MSESKHTPLPWRVGDGGITVFGPKTDAPSPAVVASRLKRADAALIVKAVNCHAELLEVAEAIYTLARDCGAGVASPVWRDLVCTVAHKAQEAIVKAKQD